MESKIASFDTTEALQAKGTQAGAQEGVQAGAQVASLRTGTGTQVKATSEAASETLLSAENKAWATNLIKAGYETQRKNREAFSEDGDKVLPTEAEATAAFLEGLTDKEISSLKALKEAGRTIQLMIVPIGASAARYEAELSKNECRPFLLDEVAQKAPYISPVFKAALAAQASEGGKVTGYQIGLADLTPSITAEEGALDFAWNSHEHIGARTRFIRADSGFKGLGLNHLSAAALATMHIDTAKAGVKVDDSSDGGTYTIAPIQAKGFIESDCFALRALIGTQLYLGTESLYEPSSKGRVRACMMRNA